MHFSTSYWDAIDSPKLAKLNSDMGTDTAASVFPTGDDTFLNYKWVANSILMSSKKATQLSNKKSKASPIAFSSWLLT